MNVPPSRSGSFSLLSRARDRRGRRARGRSPAPCAAPPRGSTGTTSPCGAATAIPTFAAGWRWISSPVNVAFTGAMPRERDRGELHEDVVDRRLDVALGEPLDELSRGARAPRSCPPRRRAGRRAPPRPRSAAARSSCARTRAATTSTSPGGADAAAAGRGGRAAPPAARARRPRRGSGPPGPVPVHRRRGRRRARARSGGRAARLDPAPPSRRCAAAAGARRRSLCGAGSGSLRRLSSARPALPRRRRSAASSASFAAPPPRPRRRSPRPLDHRDRRADLDLALGDDDLEQDAVDVGLDLLGDLVGVELVERLALRDRVALGLQPADDHARLHPLAEPRELDLGRHQRLARSQTRAPARGSAFDPGHGRHYADRREARGSVGRARAAAPRRLGERRAPAAHRAARRALARRRGSSGR